ncbi:MAG: Type 1 glutamine amidotransferase-like domain-containing protein [Bacillaceae bacterium]|nr:Type 1 glutamine amidotransferase-like domain-containing protein [Bacillaceae bacterium]
MGDLLLTSNGLYTDDIKEQFVQLVGYNLSSVRAAIITTASPEKERNKHAIKAINDFVMLGIQTVDFIDIEFDSPELLNNYQVIYINGGNPYMLLYHLKNSGADKVFNQVANKKSIIVGASAGAMVLGPHIQIVNHFTPWMNELNVNDFRGLELTDKIVFPHYDREDLFPKADGKTIEERIRFFEQMNNCNICRLKDHEFIWEQVE